MTKATSVITTLLIAALVTTLVLPRSQGQSPALAIKGFFQAATKAANSTLGR